MTDVLVPILGDILGA
jgi:hypothetical protein